MSWGCDSTGRSCPRPIPQRHGSCHHDDAGTDPQPHEGFCRARQCLSAAAESHTRTGFDAVIVVEPIDFPRNDHNRHGLLYTALTRPNKELIVVQQGAAIGTAERHSCSARSAASSTPRAKPSKRSITNNGRGGNREPALVSRSQNRRDLRARLGSRTTNRRVRSWRARLPKETVPPLGASTPMR